MQAGNIANVIMMSFKHRTANHKSSNNNKDQLLWYACYGSNMATERFLCYLQGGTYPGNSKTYAGGRDKSPPQAEANFTLKHQLYFAKEAHIWGGGGVCFIENESRDSAETLAKIYLITTGQFEDLHAQECNKQLPLNINFEAAQRRGFIDAYPEKWYGRILHLGKHQSYPIFTFTHVNDMQEFNPPAPNYLRSLVNGIKSSYRLNTDELLKYFSQKPGIAGKISNKQLANWMAA